MNPYLEKALVEYYARQRKRLLIFGAVMLVAALGVVGYVLVGKPDDGWMSVPVALVGGPCAFGVVILGVFVVMQRNPLLLRVLRERPRDIRSVQRGDTVVMEKHLGEIKRTTTLFVTLMNGAQISLQFDGDLEEFNRIQKLLEKEIAP
jgi:hypothetical protein